MKSLKTKFSGFSRKAAVVAVGAVSTMAAGLTFAAGEMGAAAATAIADAQSQGTSVGTVVVGCVAALCVVGLVIGLVRKV